MRVECISIHALREERDSSLIALAFISYISIHALREERDLRAVDLNKIKDPISIHALREERDSKKTQNRRAFFVINIEYYESFR